MGKLKISLLGFVAAQCSFLLAGTAAWAQTPYYAGKTITIVRGGGAGGSGEFQSRALMPYLSKYIRDRYSAYREATTISINSLTSVRLKWVIPTSCSLANQPISTA
jgi:hypothetical protein